MRHLCYRINRDDRDIDSMPMYIQQSSTFLPAPLSSTRHHCWLMLLLLLLLLALRRLAEMTRIDSLSLHHFSNYIAPILVTFSLLPQPLMPKQPNPKSLFSLIFIFVCEPVFSSVRGVVHCFCTPLSPGSTPGLVFSLSAAMQHKLFFSRAELSDKSACACADM